MQITPYLFFDGRCEEAIEFYRETLDAEVTMLLRFKDNPEPPTESPASPESAEKVMHGSLRIGETEIYLSDGCCTGQPSFQGFALSIARSDTEQAARTFAALADGGQVRMPMAKTFFSPAFGMVADRFGVPWMVITTS
ncbi:MAG: VOC family protein [Geminicoccaceae bacterium]